MSPLALGRRALPGLAGAFGLGAVLAGCAVGPDYERPQLLTPAAIPEAASVSTAATGVKITDKDPWDRWWTVFKEPQIDQLVGQALEGNQDLRASIARVHVARNLVREQFAPLLPSIGASANYLYQKQSKNALLFPTSGGGATGGTGGTGGTGTTGFTFTGKPFEFFSGTLDMNYELDLWGRVRRALEAATDEEIATEEDKKNAEITVIADVVSTYFDLGQADAQYEIAREAVELRTKTLDLVRGRVEAGLAAELELRRAEGELATAQADVPEAERRRAVAEHRLAILVGRPPDIHFGGKPPAAFDLPPEVPVGIPSTLLERRPDIRAAEGRLAAANARIGQAFADFFPKFTLAGRFGYASLHNYTVANPGAQLWSIGPGVSLPIFSGGLTYATWKEKQAQFDVNTAQYRQAVLKAFQEVADALSGISAHAQVRDRQHEAVIAEERAVQLANIEYEQGLTSYLNVLDSQRTLLGARNALVQAQRQLLVDLVQLQKALGGGWTETPQEGEDGDKRAAKPE